MKKNRILFAVFVLIANSIHGQTISGKIMDLETADILPFANISVYNGDVLVKVATSDIHGNYELNISNQGNYTLETTYLGYDNYKQKIQIPYAFESNDILLAPSSLVLDVVEILAYKVSIDSCYTTCGAITYNKCFCYCPGVSVTAHHKNLQSLVENKTETIIYPNPSSHFFKVRNQGKYKKLAIANMNGQWLVESQLNDEIDFVSVVNLISGTYVVLLIKANGEIDTEKLVVINN